MKQFTSKTQKIGEIGEEIACMFLMKHGYSIIERNYTRKWGEIDIVAKKNEITHFYEVKSVNVSPETLNDLKNRESSIIRPEENMNPFKIRRIFNTLETYIFDKKVDNWSFGLICVFIDSANKKAKVRIYENLAIN